MSKAEHVTFVPTETFTGYPAGHKTLFQKGVESPPVARTFAELMVEKGHATEFTPAGKETTTK